MDHHVLGLESSPALTQWVLGQSVACVILIVWILTLLRERSAFRKERLELSSLLTQTIEKGWQERFKLREECMLQLDSNQRNLLDVFTAIATKRRGLDEPFGSSGHPTPNLKTSPPTPHPKQW